MTSTAGDQRTYLIHTYGCQMNEHDSERIAGLLEADGLVRVDSEADADVIVFNTCTIRENADEKLFGNLGHMKDLKARKPDVQVVVAGCQAQKDRGYIQERAPHVDVVFGTHNVHRAAELLRESRLRGPLQGPLMEILEESDAFPSALPVRRDDDWSAWVTIQIGCDNSCAFCIVPSVRGAEISRPLNELHHEVATLAAAGVVEVTLLGQNVNSYGRDLTLKNRENFGSLDAASACGQTWATDPRGPRARPLFADLLHDVGRIEGIKRIRYTSPHPKDLRPETIEAMATIDAVMPHLHLPLQSGSDTILSEMRRGYTATSYLEKVAAARSRIDDLAITSDIIVGFPGETEADFEQTMQVCAEVVYDSVYSFIFSPRPGTPAFDYTDRFVPADVVSARFERLKLVLDRAALHRSEARIGRVEEVLVTGESKRDPLITSARTKQNKLIHFAYRDATGAQRALPAGTFALVEVTSAAPYFLRGDFREITAKPRHRRRIPVNAS